MPTSATRELRTLSGGELQRVAIAAVLTMQPSLILLDEPTSQLDPQAADSVLRLARDLRDDLGLSIVVTEHRLERVAAHADRVLHVRGDGGVASLDRREAMAILPGAPPVSRIGSALGWSPLPLSIAEARAFVTAEPSSRNGTTAATHAGGMQVASLQGVSVELGGRRVLDIDELNLREGECVAVMGRNGAGKTTLLRTLAGLQVPAVGNVGGPTPMDAPNRFRDVAYVPQDPAATLYRPTIESEIEDVLQGTGREGSVAAALAEWDLQNFASRDARDLSVGERQRAALAALLAGTPRLILLDEPTRGMDAAAKEHLVANVKRRANEGACVVVASHDVELAAAFAERVILLSEGELVADEPVRQALTGNIAFSTQASKLFGDGVLTVDDAIAHVRGEVPMRHLVALLAVVLGVVAFGQAASAASTSIIAGGDDACIRMSVAGATNEAGLKITFEDGRTVEYCIEFSEPEITGADLLFRTGLPVVTALNGGLGAAVCSIDGEGCNDPGDCFCKCRGGACAYWAYFQRKNGAWQYSPQGAGSRIIRDGDADAWVWGSGTSSPGAAVDCADPTATPTLTPPAPTPTAPPTRTPQPEPTEDEETPVATNTRTTPTLAAAAPPPSTAAPPQAGPTHTPASGVLGQETGLTPISTAGCTCRHAVSNARHPQRLLRRRRSHARRQALFESARRRAIAMQNARPRAAIGRGEASACSAWPWWRSARSPAA